MRKEVKVYQWSICTVRWAQWGSSWLETYSKTMPKLVEVLGGWGAGLDSLPLIPSTIIVLWLLDLSLPSVTCFSQSATKWFTLSWAGHWLLECPASEFCKWKLLNQTLRDQNDFLCKRRRWEKTQDLALEGGHVAVSSMTLARLSSRCVNFSDWKAKRNFIISNTKWILHICREIAQPLCNGLLQTF